MRATQTAVLVIVSVTLVLAVVVSVVLLSTGVCSNDTNDNDAAISQKQLASIHTSPEDLGLGICKSQLASLDATLQRVYADLGGMPLRKRCSYVVSPDNNGDNATASARRANRDYCLHSFANRHGGNVDSDFYRAFRDQWRGLVRTSPVASAQGGALTIGGEARSSSSLADPNIACNVLVENWAPEQCQGYTMASAPAEMQRYADVAPWLGYCAAFAYFYNGHYKILNKWVSFVDKYVAAVAAGAGADAMYDWFVDHYTFFIANGTFRWNSNNNHKQERFSSLAVDTPYACQWVNWKFPSREATWESAGLPAQFFNEAAFLLDTAFEAMPGLPCAVVVYKGIEPDKAYADDFLGGVDLLRLKKGDEFTMSGYNSTTLDINVALAYTCDFNVKESQIQTGKHGCVLLRIALPKGTICHYKHDNTNYTYQVLLPRQRTFRLQKRKTYYIYGRAVCIIDCKLCNPTDALPHFADDAHLSAPFDLDAQNRGTWPKWVQTMYQNYTTHTACAAPVVNGDAYAQNPMRDSLVCFLQLQQLAISDDLAQCAGSCVLRDTYPSNAPLETTVYRVVAPDEEDPDDPTGGLMNGDSADLEGQLTYLTYLPQRHADWATRVIKQYVVRYSPLTRSKCSTSKDEIVYGQCPPFGVYAKCNPAGCASKTQCQADAECPGKGGVCTNGKCVCCTPSAACTLDRDCGTGKCVDGACTCDGIDMRYKCNVAEYPSHTNSVMGDTQHVGAVRAPFDSSDYPDGSWIPGGWWYSTPEGGLCTDGSGSGVGATCAWWTKGVERQYTLQELADAGFAFYCDPSKTPAGITCLPKKEVLENQQRNYNILQQLFARAPPPPAAR